MKSAVAKGVLIVGGSRVVVSILGVLSNIALARLLTPNDFGLVAIAGTISTLVLALTELPISSLLLQLDDIDSSHMDAAWTANLLRVLAVGVLFCALALPVAAVYDDDRLFPIMLAIAAGTLLGSLGSPRTIEFSKQLRFDVENKILVAQRLAGVTSAFVCAYSTHSYWALLAGTYASDLAGVALSQVYAPYRPRYCTKHLRFFIKQGMWLSLMQFATTLSTRADPLLIGYFADKSMLGSYTVGSNLASIPTRETVAPLAQPLLPGFARLRGDDALTRSTYRKAQALLFAIAFPAGVGMSLLAPQVVSVFLGEKWNGCVPVIRALAAMMALQTLSTLSSPLALARGENRLLSLRSVAMFAIRVPAVAIGVALGGLNGCLIGLCIAGSIGMLANMLLVRQIIGLSLIEQLTVNINTFVATLAMAVAVVMLPRALQGPAMSQLSIALLSVAVGAVIYAASRLAMLWLSPHEAVVENETRLLLKRLRSSR